MPREAMNDKRDNTCVTPLRSMRKRWIFQLPLLMLLSRLAVINWLAIDLPMSNTAALFALEIDFSACRKHS